jgi:hypothetical protein
MTRTNLDLNVAESVKEPEVLAVKTPAPKVLSWEDIEGMRGQDLEDSRAIATALHYALTERREVMVAPIKAVLAHHADRSSGRVSGQVIGALAHVPEGFDSLVFCSERMLIEGGENIHCVERLSRECLPDVERTIGLGGHSFILDFHGGYAQKSAIAEGTASSRRGAQVLWVEGFPHLIALLNWLVQLSVERRPTSREVPPIGIYFMGLAYLQAPNCGPRLDQQLWNAFRQLAWLGLSSNIEYTIAVRP